MRLKILYAVSILALILIVGGVFIVRNNSANQEKSEEKAFLLIKGGCFFMGSPETELERDSDETRRRVCVNDFYLARTEVTNREYLRFRPEHASDKYMGYDVNKREMPVSAITLDAAWEYLEWLNQRSESEYRLPTESEWEYAARAGSSTSRPWGDDPDQACRFANVADETAAKAWGAKAIHQCDDLYPTAAPVGSFQPNSFGLYDMLGNVWEWTSETTAKPDPLKWDTHYVRGGSWHHGPKSVRSANRGPLRSFDTNIDIGFRLVKVK